MREFGRGLVPDSRFTFYVSRPARVCNPFVGLQSGGLQQHAPSPTLAAVSKPTAFYVSSFLAIGTLLLYWPAGHYDFVLADDYQYVCHNAPVLKGLSRS